jgi:hypothetical protein
LNPFEDPFIKNYVCDWRWEAERCALGLNVEVGVVLMLVTDGTAIEKEDVKGPPLENAGCNLELR